MVDTTTAGASWAPYWPTVPSVLLTDHPLDREEMNDVHPLLFDLTVALVSPEAGPVILPRQIEAITHWYVQWKAGAQREVVFSTHGLTAPTDLGPAQFAPWALRSILETTLTDQGEPLDHTLRLLALGRLHNGDAFTVTAAHDEHGWACFSRSYTATGSLKRVLGLLDPDQITLMNGDTQ